MSTSSIGIQVIMPRTGTTPKQTPPPQANDRDTDNAAVVAEAVAKQAPPPPGMGKLVDKTV
jgi:hypothetical protein